MLKSLIGYAEKGLLPDFLIRVGIRKLCRVRLNWAQEIGHTSTRRSSSKVG